MALNRLTRITSVGISSGITLNSATLTGVTTLTEISASGDLSADNGTFTGDLSVGGVLTYEDVNNIDSVGIITARDTIDAQGNITVGAGLSVVGVSTVSDNFHVGSAITMYSSSGIVSATSFYGDGSSLTGIDATSLKDSDQTVRVQANTSGVDITGVATATTFSGDVTGNLTGDVNAGLITATSSIVVGDTFIKPTSIGIGTTTTAGRNAGVGTAIGTIVYNSNTDQLQTYTSIGWRDLVNAVVQVSGGTVDTSSRPGWTVHSFTSDGNLTMDGTLSS